METVEAPTMGLRATVSRDYGGLVGLVLDDFSIKCEAGEIVAVVGSSGSGKSTLLQSLAEAVTASDNEKTVECGSLSPKGYAFAFQEPELIPWRDAEGNARFEVELANGAGAIVHQRAHETMRIVGLSDAFALFPSQLSTGMRQRLQLARVIARRAPVVLLDEPLAAVDQPTRLGIARALRQRFRDANSAVIWVTHDLLEALTVADRILAVGGRPLRIIHEMCVGQGERPHISTEANASSVSVAVDTLLTSLESGMKSIGAPAQRTLLIRETAPTTSASSIGQTRLRIHAIQLFLVLALVIAWELLIAVRPSLAFFLPPPHDWVTRLFERLATTDLARQAWVTLREALVGLSLGFTVGTLLGYTTEFSEHFGRAVRPFWVGLTAVPLFVLAPAFIVWFGIGEPMKVALAACSAAPFASLAVLDGVAASHGRFFAYLRANGIGRSRLFARFVLPHTVASWFLGLRAGAIAALLGAFLGEFISANQGLGYSILLDAGRYRLGDVLGGVALLFSIAVMLDVLFRWLGAQRHRILYRLKI